MGTLTTGVRLKEVVTREGVTYTDCSVLHADGVGLVFEVNRIISEGGTVETVVSQVLLPWSNVRHVIVMEEVT